MTQTTLEVIQDSGRGPMLIRIENVVRFKEIGECVIKPETTYKFFDLQGKEMSISDVAEDFSNVGAISRIQNMTVKQYEDTFLHA